MTAGPGEGGVKREKVEHGWKRVGGGREGGKDRVVEEAFIQMFQYYFIGCFFF